MEHPEYTHKSSIQGDGGREKILVADVAGPFQRLKKWVYPLLMVILFSGHLVTIEGRRLFLFDVLRRQFFIFGFGFNAQDIYLLFFLVTGAAFFLFYLTALLGRIWCGWACPQTVFLDGVYRKIERLLEGNRSRQLKLQNSPWHLKKIGLFATKHFLYLLISLFLSYSVLSYFNPHQNWQELLTLGISSHPLMFTWWITFSGVLWFNFGWFREQLCLIICPYGRLQSTLTDDDSLVIGYDEKRGEPRGKMKNDDRGDCIDCNRCVTVCPTGIDIRAGLQMECIGCANCIDACNEIMAKIDQKPGLIRYDSLKGLNGKKTKILRPRIYSYTALMLIGATVAAFAFSKRTSFEANILRMRGLPYKITAGDVRNQFELHVFNKSADAQTFNFAATGEKGLRFTMPIKNLTIPALKDARIPLFVSIKEDAFKSEADFSVTISTETGKILGKRTARFLGPSRHLLVH